MEHSDFSMGLDFYCGSRKWRVTDMGTRTIIAILLTEGSRENLHQGPPYAVAETVFDENDFPGCSLTDPFDD